MSEELVYIRGREGAAPIPAPKLSPRAEERVKAVKASYPDSRSAVMTALYIAQEEIGHINQSAVEWVADRIGMPAIQVWEVATFYTMFYKKPVGKYHVQVCRTLPCALRGAKKVSEFFRDRLGVKPGEVTKDGMWSYQEVECLGSCGTAPMCQINDVFFENLDEEKLKKLAERIEKEKPDLRFSPINDRLGDGLSDQPRSVVRIASKTE